MGHVCFHPLVRQLHLVERLLWLWGLRWQSIAQSDPSILRGVLGATAVIIDGFGIKSKVVLCFTQRRLEQ
jgi:hypothetical protein